ncbi:MAG: translation initiation factor IF-1 [Bryobacterales bacterium]
MGADDGVNAGRGAAGKLVEAVVEEELPNALYRLTLADRTQVLAHVGEKRANDFLRLLPGDRVEVRLSPYDDRRGRILRRVRQ